MKGSVGVKTWAHDDFMGEGLSGGKGPAPSPTASRRLRRQDFVSSPPKGARKLWAVHFGPPFFVETGMTDQLEASLDMVAQGERIAGLAQEVAALKGALLSAQRPALDGVKGGMEDPARAAHWFTKAAEQGLKEAQYHLGLMYEFEKDLPVLAALWYTMAMIGLLTTLGFAALFRDESRQSP